MPRTIYKVITGRPPMVKEIKLAKKLYKPPYISLQDVADLMSKRLKRKVHKKQVDRWINYSVDKIKA